MFIKNIHCIRNSIFIDIGKISLTLPTFNPKKENNNKPLANLSEPIKDTFTFRGKKSSPLETATNEVAETNAVTNTFTDSKISCLGARAQYLQQHFPETIAKIRDAMNWKDDISAIEYYGT